MDACFLFMLEMFCSINYAYTYTHVFAHMISLTSRERRREKNRNIKFIFISLAYRESNPSERAPKVARYVRSVDFGEVMNSLAYFYDFG